MDRTLLVMMVKAVVSSPGSVRVEERVEADSTFYEVWVDPSDIGYAIGKEGRVATAIRTGAKAAARRRGIKVFVDVKGHAGATDLGAAPSRA